MISVSPVDIDGEGAVIELDEEETEVVEEARKTRQLASPYTPTAKEVEEHRLTHLPYRSWCPECVQGRARNRPHRRAEQPKEYRVPQVVVDYAFLGDKEDTETLAIQVARGVWSGYLLARAIPRKGLSHEHGAQELVRDIEKLGHGQLDPQGRQRAGHACFAGGGEGQA